MNTHVQRLGLVGLISPVGLIFVWWLLFVVFHLLSFEMVLLASMFECVAIAFGFGSSIVAVIGGFRYRSALTLMIGLASFVLNGFLGTYLIQYGINVTGSHC